MKQVVSGGPWEGTKAVNPPLTGAKYLTLISECSRIFVIQKLGVLYNCYIANICSDGDFLLLWSLTIELFQKIDQFNSRLDLSNV